MYVLSSLRVSFVRSFVSLAGILGASTIQIFSGVSEHCARFQLLNAFMHGIASFAYHVANVRGKAYKRCQYRCVLASKGGVTDIPDEVAIRHRRSRIVCVGDVHGQWGLSDELALQALEPHLVMFVGDYGNEDIRVTRRIAEFARTSSFGVATVFGNHDAFYTATHIGRANCPYDQSVTCRVTEQMELLADYDASYKSIPFDDIGVSVCGGRSWSWGGPYWKHSKFYRNFVGIANMAQSSKKIVSAVSSSKHDVVMFLSHSGPVGLGDKPSDPCGRDWGVNPGGDYGDSDLRDGIEHARARGLRVPLTVFGHMHKSLQNGQGERTMLVTEPDGDSGCVTVMLNAAVVPRHRRHPKETRKTHNFHIVQLDSDSSVETVEEVWVAVNGRTVQTSTLYQNHKSLSTYSPIVR